jgi:predicted GH43/DUF377 family glycosyl hydrolase
MIEKLLLKPEDFKPSVRKWTIDGIFNPGAMRRKDKKIVLYVRVAERSPQHRTMITCPVISGTYKVRHDRIEKNKMKIETDNLVYFKDGSCRLTNLSHFREVVLNENGTVIEKISQKPTFTGLPADGEYGVEDPRFTKIKNQYLMTYVIINIKEGVCTSLAVSKNLRDWERKGIIFRTQNKDVVIFPEKINGKYAALHRPEGNFVFSKPNIWISYSPDLIHWGEEKAILQTRNNSWDEKRIGAGTPPIKTEEGWIEIYHGVKDTPEEKSIYSAGAALLDLKNPAKVLARTSARKPLFAPKEDYEKQGFMDSVVFPTGIVPDLDKESVLIYSGAADSCISIRKVRIKDILNSMEYYW